MSFGFGIGDFLAVGTLALDLYKQCRNSPGEYKALAGDMRSLTFVLQDIGDLISEHRLTAAKEDELLEHKANTRILLTELQEMLEKYRSLDTQSRRTWDRLRWNGKAVTELRARIMTTVTMLNSFYASVTSSTLFQLTRSMNQYLQEVHAGRREGSVVSLVTNNVTEVDEDVWQQVTRDLDDMGISSQAIAEHKDYIVSWLSKAFKEGMFQESLPDRDNTDPGGLPRLPDEPRASDAWLLEAVRQKSLRDRATAMIVWGFTSEPMDLALNACMACNLMNEDMTLLIVSEESLLATLDNMEKKYEAIMTQADGIISLEALALAIDGKSLGFAMSKEGQKIFWKLASFCVAVLCCEVTAQQKHDVSKLVKKQDKRNLIASNIE